MFLPNVPRATFIPDSRVGAFYYVLAAAEGNNQEAPRKHPLMVGDLHKIGNSTFLGSTHG